MKTRIFFMVITLFSAAIASLQSARAATITVTNTNDSGAGSLRAALADANPGDIIDFDSSLEGQRITLTSGQLLVDKDVTINGPGANKLAVDGNAQSGVFGVGPNVSKTVVTISGLTITNGNEGGIFNLDAALMVIDCTISANSGSGIFNLGQNGGARLTVTDCIVSGNSAGYGGGIANVGFNGNATLTIINSTVSGNSTTGNGGGILSSAGGGYSGYATVTVNNSTISDNSADDGGGIWNASGNRSFAGVTVSNSTISGNRATGNGGGIFNHADATSVATFETRNTIFDAGSPGQNIFNDTGTVISHGYNLSSDDAGGYLIGSGDQINAHPLLGPLQDNGGPTFTHALLPGSPAINAGDPNFTPPPFYDQRGPGFHRVVTSRIDIGSFEVQGPTPTPRPSPTARPRPTLRPRPGS